MRRYSSQAAYPPKSTYACCHHVVVLYVIRGSAAPSGEGLRSAGDGDGDNTTVVAAPSVEAGEGLLDVVKLPPGCAL